MPPVAGGIFYSQEMKIAIIGCGNMGLIYARAFLKYNIVDKDQLLLVEKNPERMQALRELDLGVVCLASDSRICSSEVIILAVKPQDFSEVAATLRTLPDTGSVWISIMAGMRIARIRTMLNRNNIVRAMPNSPAELGMGMTAYAADEFVAASQLRKAERLLSTTGRIVFLEQEDLLDAVTAISGSGPAYFFYLVRHMIEAGKEMGFDEGTAAMLVKQTMLGSWHLMNKDSRSLDELIKAVASRGGTTEAALNSFEQEGVGKGLRKSMLKAKERSAELAAGD
jgi:pyrroline-5-carboxylate reductase